MAETVEKEPSKPNGLVAPFILVGTKSDLRKKVPAQETLVTTAQAKACRQKVSASSYLECSAKENDNIEAVFDAAIKACNSTSKPAKTPKWCALL